MADGRGRARLVLDPPNEHVPLPVRRESRTCGEVFPLILPVNILNVDRPVLSKARKRVATTAETPIGSAGESGSETVDESLRTSPSQAPQKLFSTHWLSGFVAL